MVQFISLLFPLLLTLTSAAPYRPPHMPLCKLHPVMKLRNITYHSEVVYSTPSHLAVHYGTVAFNLSDTGVEYTTHCTATSDAWTVPFYGSMVYSCDLPAGPGVGKGAMTNFTFSETDGTFRVNQTFNCWNDRTHKTQKLLAYGTGAAHLDCHTKSWTNPDFQMGELYHTESKTCKPTKLRIVPTLIAAPKR